MARIFLCGLGEGGEVSLLRTAIGIESKPCKAWKVRLCIKLLYFIDLRLDCD